MIKTFPKNIMNIHLFEFCEIKILFKNFCLKFLFFNIEIYFFENLPDYQFNPKISLKKLSCLPEEHSHKIKKLFYLQKWNKKKSIWHWNPSNLFSVPFFTGNIKISQGQKYWGELLSRFLKDYERDWGRGGGVNKDHKNSFLNIIN